MKVLLTGANGQLGQELQTTKPIDIELVALDRQQLDITHAHKVHDTITKLQPECIINAAAYTAVDDAEAHAELAYAVNSAGPAHLAQAAYIQGARLIHISTDYVFDGAKAQPYLPEDLPNPLGCYGMSKLGGEKRVQEIAPQQVLIIRTSWVYSMYGRNFVKTLLQILNSREQLSMVTDQIGSPTWAKTLARAIWQAVRKPNLFGIYHWSDTGLVSKYEFVMAIQEEALKLGLLKREIPIVPIKTQDYPSAAKRPLFSALNSNSSCKDFELIPMHWRFALRDMLTGLKNA